jgi:hypothetical protein
MRYTLLQCAMHRYDATLSWTDCHYHGRIVSIMDRLSVSLKSVIISLRMHRAMKVTMIHSSIHHYDVNQDVNHYDVNHSDVNTPL